MRTGSGTRSPRIVEWVASAAAVERADAGERHLAEREHPPSPVTIVKVRNTMASAALPWLTTPTQKLSSHSGTENNARATATGPTAAASRAAAPWRRGRSPAPAAQVDFEALAAQPGTRAGTPASR